MPPTTRQVDDPFSLREEFIRFLKAHLQLLLVWPVIALIFGIVGWVHFLSNLDRTERQAKEAALQHAAVLAQNYAERIHSTVDNIDRLLLHIRYGWQSSQGVTRLENASRAGIFPPDAVFLAAVIDADGRLLTSSIPDNTFSLVGDEPYFLFHKETNTDVLYIGSPTIGRFSKRGEVIQFSRRLENQKGQFAGVVLATVLPALFTSNYTVLMFGQNGLLGVVGKDNVVRATRIGNEAHSIQAPLLLAPLHLRASRGSDVFSGKTWFVDKRNRYVGWEAVRDYPLVAFVGLDEQEALAEYRANRAAAMSNAVWNTIGLALLTLCTMVFSLVLARRKEQLESIRTAYRIATEEGDNGFYINRPLRDKNGRIVDFLVVDCNQRGAQLFKLTREQLIGKKLSDFYDGEVLKLAIKRLCDALEHGIHESEIKVSQPDLLQASWINYKAVRSGNDLSVTIRDISESKAHEQELERRGNEDILTRLPNRQWIQQYLPKAIKRAHERDAMLALLFVDMDGFKAINDALGHTAGDELLRAIAKRLKITVRPIDHVVRLGSDEFLIILENASHKTEVQHLAERIRYSFRDGFLLAHGVHALTASIGISMYPDDGEDAETLLKNADIAMYWAKTSGKGNYRFFEPHFSEISRARLNNEIELRQAIEEDQFVMHYQPRIDLVTGATASMEALVRWEHPTKGLIAPLEFIHLAEDTGLIVQLGESIIHKICDQLSQWTRSGQKVVPVSVNVSPRQFDESDVPGIFSAALSRYQISASLLEIEVTESSMMSEHPGVADSLSKLREMGIKLCIDDFGTGYSSLSQLQKLDFDVLKVDRAFTMEIETKEGEALFAAIITMAHSLGMRVVAEGVEYKKQMQLLKALHCDEVQGYYVSRPIPAAAVQPISPQSFLPFIGVNR